MRKLRIVVTGLIAQYPLGGVAWDYIQYVVGLQRLGHDVYYFEDTGQWPFNPAEGGISRTCTFNVNYLSAVMKHFGLADRWAYKFPLGPQWFGLSAGKRSAVLRSADVLLNISGSLASVDDYRSIKRLVYIDTDPVFTQIKLLKKQPNLTKLVQAHDCHFSFGERLPSWLQTSDVDWSPTRQPVVLEEWECGAPVTDRFTTIMNWTSYKPLEWNDRAFGQKDVEFEKFVNLPARLPEGRLEIAINAGKTRRTPKDRIRQLGWRVVDPDAVCPDITSYREYIQNSRAEWSVAKNGYVEGQAGWFSCRSACYLAAGRPVVIQDTGLEGLYPTGLGLMCFCSFEEALNALREVDRDYARHAAAATAIAREYFDSERILTRLLETTLVACRPGPTS